MVRNARFANAEPVGDLAGGQVAFPEEIQDAAPSGIVERSEQLVHKYI